MNNGMPMKVMRRHDDAMKTNAGFQKLDATTTVFEANFHCQFIKP
jgi:hypothetical protein